MKYQVLPEDNQRTKDWLIERLGCVTGSQLGKVMSNGRKKDDPFSETAKDYLYEIMSERELSTNTIGDEDTWLKYRELTDIYNSKAMQFGTDNEEDAIAAFESWLHDRTAITIDGVEYHTKDLVIKRTGSIAHSTIQNFAASPDAVVVDSTNDEVLAIIECKVPLPKTFVKYRSEINDAESLKASKSEYYWQMTAEMMVTDTKKGFFVAYNPFLITDTHIAEIDIVDEDKSAVEVKLGLVEEFINSKRGY